MKNFGLIVVGIFIIVGVSKLFNLDTEFGDGLPDKGKLVVWQTESDPGALAVLKDIEEEFERKHPYIDLKIKTVGWGDLSADLGIAQRKQEYPDVSHIQPFMASSLVSKGLLQPITELVNELEEIQGGILPAVRDLQLIEGEYYGLAYAAGTTFWLNRVDKIPGSISIAKVKSWRDYLEMVSASKAKDNEFLVTLPGGSPFFIHQLYGELLANAGGRFFNPLNLKPDMESKANIAVLTFFRELANSGALDPAWATTSYSAQFEKIADGVVHSVPVTYARASKNIERRIGGNGAVVASPSVYGWLKQPVSKYRATETHIATIDAEPYVVFRQALTKKYQNGSNNYDLAIEFLKLFYSEKYYSKFTAAVPVQLTPIFRDMAASEHYLEAVGKWTPWHNQTMALLSAPGRTRPIMMPDASESAKNIPFLLEFEASGIISKAVSASITKKEKQILEIATDMQRETEIWLKAIDYKGKAN